MHDVIIRPTLRSCLLVNLQQSKWHLSKSGIFVLDKSYFGIVYINDLSPDILIFYIKGACDVINDFDTCYREIEDKFS